jgi:3(or 17)beta-hydroxysteroid dehydrogenase
MEGYDMAMNSERTGRVEGRVAIVTGAASGLGAAHAAALAREGARVVLTDVNAPAGREVSAAIPGSMFLEHDVREESHWNEVIRATTERFGRLDILVNNAGLVRFGSIEDCTLEDYRFINSVMAEGTFLGCKLAIPPMTRTGGGSIINTASVAAIRGKSPVLAYTAAKGAIVALTRSVAAHCLDRGNRVRCNVLLPGGHETPMAVQSRQALAALPADTRGALAHVARGPVTGRPEDIAKVVVFLASDEAIGMTGASIVVDNGETLK